MYGFVLELNMLNMPIYMHFDASTEKDRLSAGSIYELPALGFFIDMNMSHYYSWLSMSFISTFRWVRWINHLKFAIFYISRVSYLSTVLLALRFFTCNILFNCIEDMLLSNS